MTSAIAQENYAKNVKDINARDMNQSPDSFPSIKLGETVCHIKNNNESKMQIEEDKF